MTVFKFKFPGLYLPEFKKLRALLDRLQAPRPVTTLTEDATLAATHWQGRVVSSGAGDVDVTVPPNADVAFPIGTEIDLVRGGTGALAAVAGAGVTINVLTGKSLAIAAQHTSAKLVKTAADVWTLEGNLANA